MIRLKKYGLQDAKQFLFVALFAFPILSLKVTNALFILFSLLVVFLFIKQKQSFSFKEYLPYFLFTLPFIPYLIEFLVYPNNKIIQFELEKKLFFFAAPLVLYIDSESVKLQLKNASVCFITGVALLSFISIIYLMGSGNLFLESNYLNGAYGLRFVFENFSGLHPTYYGLFSTTASLWIIHYLENYSGKYKIVMISFLIVLLVVNMLIASKMPLLIMLLGLLWIGYKKTSNKLKLGIIYLSFFAGLTALIFVIPSLKNRLLEIPHFFTFQMVNNTIFERFIIFNCSKSIFLSDIITGVGARNIQGVLDYCYVWFGFSKGALIHLNPHNQYLSIGICYGLGILVLFLLTLFVLFLRIKNSAAGIIFFFSLIFIMFTESILERQMGVYYFLFFALLFMMQIKNGEKKDRRLSE